MNEMREELVKVGRVTHYFTNIGVAVIELCDDLKVGDEILVRGQTSNLSQVVDSMEIDRVKVEKAGKGQSIGLKIKDRVRHNDDVYRISK